MVAKSTAPSGNDAVCQAALFTIALIERPLYKSQTLNLSKILYNAWLILK